MPLAGTSFGRYVLVEPIGAGGMGVVYRARDTRLAREVALKVMDERRLASESALSRFLQEARLAGALNHPNVLAVFDAGEEEGVPFLVTELLNGQTLRQRLALGALPWREALGLAAQAAAGLAAAHARAIIHRDLKPENLFLTSEGRLKILDFGVAKLLERAASDSPELRFSVTGTATGDGVSTGAGVALGTPAYMSPEQVRGEPADSRSDVFSFGCVLHELLAGERPFSGRTPFEVGAAILSSAPQLLPGGVPPGLSRLVARCLHKRPDLRYADGAELRAALETCLESGESRAPARPRSRAALGAAGLAGIAIGGLCVWAVARRPDRAAAAAPTALPQAALPSGAGAVVLAGAPASIPPPAAPVPPAAADAPTPALRTVPVARAAQKRAPPAKVAASPGPAVAVQAPRAEPAPTDAGPPQPQDGGADARLARIDALLRAGKFKDAKAEAERQLAAGEGPSTERGLLKRLIRASYDDGDDEAALRYSLRYQPLCPAAERGALDKQIARLSVNLGLGAER